MLTVAEKDIILRLAQGDNSARPRAIAIYREHARYRDDQSTLHMRFMAEVDNKCPDLSLRAEYRKRLKDGIEHNIFPEARG